jgi:DNA modification methylase
MKELDSQKRLEYNANGIPRVKKYLHEMDGIPVRDLWIDINQIQGSEKLDYATQKPVKLLERIVNMFSNKGDLVLDPFAGSGTTGRACINTNRNYIMLDINSKGKKYLKTQY